MNKTAKITISLPQELVAIADSIALEKKISRSQAISECLRVVATKRQNDLLQQGYIEMAEEHKKSVEYFRSSQSEIFTTGKQ